MLESAQTNETWGRYTFLGLDPKLEITCLDGVMKIGNLTIQQTIRRPYLREFLPITKVRVLTICRHLQVGLSGIFHTIISATVSQR